MAKELRTNILDYRVIIEKEYHDDGTPVHSASCPTLGVFDYGDSIEKTLTGIKDGIESAIAFLTEQNREIPVDYLAESIVTFAEIEVPLESARLVPA